MAFFKAILVTMATLSLCCVLAAPIPQSFLDDTQQIILHGDTQRTDASEAASWITDAEDNDQVDERIFGLFRDEDEDDWIVEYEEDFDMIPIKTPDGRTLTQRKSEWNRYNDEDVNTALLMVSSSDIDDHVVEMAIISRVKELFSRKSPVQPRARVSVFGFFGKGYSAPDGSEDELDFERVNF